MKSSRTTSSTTLIRTFAILFMTISLVGVCLTGASYVYTLYSYRASIYEYNTATIEYIKGSLEDSLNSVEQSAQDISLSIMMHEFDEITDAQDPYNLYLFSKLISVVTYDIARNDFTSGAYVYFSNSDTIVSSHGLSSTEEFYANHLDAQAISYQEWMASLCTHMDSFYRISQTGYNGSNYEFVKPFNALSTSTYGCMVIMLNDSEITETLSESSLLNVANISITYLPNDTTIYQTEDTALNDYVKALDIAVGTHGLENTAFGDLLVIKSLSINRNWVFISAIPYSVFFSDTQRVIIPISVLLCLQVLLGAALTIVFSKQSYKPIKHFTSDIKHTLHNEDYAGTGDDLVDVHNIASELMLHFENAQAQLTDVKPIVVNNFLFRLIQGNSFERQYMSQYFFDQTEVFAHDGFIIVKVTLEDNNNFMKSDSVKEWELAKLAVMNISQELMSEKIHTTSINYDLRNVAFVLNTPYTTQPDEIASMQAQIDAILNKIQNALENIFTIYTSVGVSQLLHGLASLHDCHKQASYALNQKIASSQYGITHFTEVTMKTHAYSYTLQDELYLINSVKTGDAAQVKKILRGIIAENQDIFHSNDDVLCQCLLMDLVSTMLRIIEDLSIPNDIVPINLPTLLCDSSHKRNSEKMISYYERLSLWVHDHKKSHNTEKKEEIVQYLRDNFRDNSLSLVAVADQVALNPTYLSVFIKEQLGETFINYVLNLRMQEAQRLLRETKLSQQEIATQIGYANSGVFIRVFKKKFGQTPGMYRQMFKEQDDLTPSELENSL